MHSSTQESDDALVAPLLRSGVVSSEQDTDEGGLVSGFEMMGGSANTDIRMTGPPTLQRRLYQVAQMRTAADLLPSLFYVVVSNGKMAFPIFAAVYLIFVSLWFPFWLLSFLTTEWGVYALAVGTVFFAGRCIIRLIAFPGASQKVTGEIEAEFARYSVRMVTSAADSFAEVAAALTSNDKTAGSSGSSYQLPGLWKRAKSFRDRVLGVYLEVLLYIFQQPSESSVNHASSDLTKYGSNRLSGDIGNLSGLTVRSLFRVLVVLDLRLRLLVLTLRSLMAIAPSKGRRQGTHGTPASDVATG